MSRLNSSPVVSGMPTGSSPAHASHARVMSSDTSLIVLRFIPWIGLGIGALLALLAPGVTRELDWLPFLGSLFILGMPHGAMDWFVQNRLGDHHGLSAQFRAFLPYLAWMGVSITALVLLPVLTVAAFMLLTVIHFGTADLLACRHGGDSTLRRTLFIVGRGCIILGPLFAFHPEAAWKPFGLLIGSFPVSALFLEQVSMVGTICLVIGVAATTLSLITTALREPRLAALDLIESGLILALASLAAPLFAIGLFFLTTHAYRHSVRLVSKPFESGTGAQSTPLWSRLVQMHARCLPLLVPTFAILVLWSLIQFGTITPYLFVVVSIGFFIISTLPHHLLGLRLPRYRP
ncbi:MAG: Brp/Blh family beta-carotene 15,15'-dioxygenase [Planctomycetota bacterium]|nr:Brp/Blh family beta-carotene 15,15'-dioxygenase [Planctomycetota bacterium]